MDLRDLQDSVDQIEGETLNPEHTQTAAPNEPLDPANLSEAQLKAVLEAESFIQLKERGQLTARLWYQDHSPKPTLNLNWAGHEHVQASLCSEDEDAGFVKLKHVAFGRSSSL
jgi:hypothetical protein